MNCLRCGRTVPDQILLCPECLAEKDKPVQAKIEPLQEEVQKEQLKKLRKKHTRIRRCLALFMVLTIAATILLAGQWYIMQQQSDRMAAQTSRINSLETAMQETQSELDQANALNDSMKDAIATAQQTIEQYQTVTGLTPEEIETLPPLVEE
ncbi:MAG: hypothetical protein E7464_00390 [Ruminococcaceae bacterium]|nr:hypothetical protein [Oscillospiraceae bacterium]